MGDRRPVAPFAWSGGVGAAGGEAGCARGNEQG